jgi:heat-inducible transcriptional repressor
VRNRYKHTELVAIFGAKVLLVLVLQDGSVKQQIFDLDQPMEQSALSETSNELNDRLVGLDAGEVEAMMGRLTPFAQQVSLLVISALHATDNQLSGQIYRDGLAQILDQPEFAEGDPVRRIVRVFEERSLLEQIVGELGGNGDVRILIAGDGRVPELRDISLVISRYGVEDRATGVLGVVGPVRMAYGRSVGAVRYIAALMSEMVGDIYGPASDTPN